MNIKEAEQAISNADKVGSPSTHIDLDNFFDDYRPILHLTKEEFNIWYNNLQRDLNMLIKQAKFGSPARGKEEDAV